MLLSQWGRAAAQIVSLVVLARLLAPSDYGLVAMTAALVGLALVVGDFGLSLAAIQAPSLSDGQRSNLFWLNTALGALGAALIAAAAPAIAAFYGEPRLVCVTLALALVFLLNGATVQFIVELNRAGRFGAIGGAQLAAQVAAVSGAIALAASGAGYVALVAQQLGCAALLLVLTAAFSGWRPTRPRRDASIRPLLRFGGGSLVSQVLGYVVSNLDSVLIGRTFSATVLGVYNRAYTVAMLPVAQVLDPLTRVVVPRLAASPDAETLNRRLQTVQRALSLIILAPLSLVLACGPQLLVVALGPQWAAGGVVLRVLAIAAILQSANYVYYWAFMARARPGLLFMAEVWGKALMVVLLLAVVAAGPLAVAWAVVAGGVAGLVGAVRVGRRIEVSALALGRAAGEPVALFACSGAGAWAVSVAAGGEHAPLQSLIAGSATWAACAALGVALLPGLRADARGLLARLAARRAPQIAEAAR